jgi:hypothetical protein
MMRELCAEYVAANPELLKVGNTAIESEFYFSPGYQVDGATTQQDRSKKDDTL